MFRNPRANNVSSGLAKPSVGRPPSPDLTGPSSLATPHHAAEMSTTKVSPKTVDTAPKGIMTSKSTLLLKGSRSKGKQNNSILKFFRKVQLSPENTDNDNVDPQEVGDDERSLFVIGGSNPDALLPAPPRSPSLEVLCADPSVEAEDPETRYNEDETPTKRRRTDLSWEHLSPTAATLDASFGNGNCSVNLPKQDSAPTVSKFSETKTGHNTEPMKSVGRDCSPEAAGVGIDTVETGLSTKPKHEGCGPKRDENGSIITNEPKAFPLPNPFDDGSDSDDNGPVNEGQASLGGDEAIDNHWKDAKEKGFEDGGDEGPIHGEGRPVQLLKRESTIISDDRDDFEGLDFEEDEFAEGEEYLERRLMEEQRLLEMEENGVCQNQDDMILKELESSEQSAYRELSGPTIDAQPCPICAANLGGLATKDAEIHVNGCLDGNPIPLPVEISKPSLTFAASMNPNRFQRQVKPAKPGQANPFRLGAERGASSSAFSRLMSSHAEDAAWATAAAAEQAARGKPAFQRTCPFYKILPGFSICVDAFRYGAVEGCQAYFLSHFHSDHYIGLTSSWVHGPILCSRVTGNLVKQQLRVNPEFVVDIEFENKTEVPGTKGVFVTMIPANHCPGSSLFLFEKVVGKGNNPKVQRVLHCGDFRACSAHIRHPLLRPSLLDPSSGNRIGQQKIDVCYLDTTYLNPRYAFPSQEQVIGACADMCVSLRKEHLDLEDEWEKVKQRRAGSGMTKFVQGITEGPAGEKEDDNIDAMRVNTLGMKKGRGRLLVVVGTYSIGKERICMGIARALDCKIFAPPGKLRICACLEDSELNARLTSNPQEAQVHMTPLFEIRAETLQDYLNAYKPHFSRVVGFRPSGWNYKPPNSRFVESPAVQTVLQSANWKSTYSMAELIPQRGSTREASCFGVPYSEHSSFRELTMFCCALRIDKIIPTVNIGSAKSREKMKSWFEKWSTEKKKNGLYQIPDDLQDW